MKWLEEADFEAKIVVAGMRLLWYSRLVRFISNTKLIAGNHDITLDQEFYAEHGLYFHNNNPQNPSDCLALFTSSPSLTYLRHEAATVRLQSPSGPHTEFRIFGSPYSPRHGNWAFYYDAPQNLDSFSDITPLWQDVPLGTDIVVTHTPPRMHCDETEERRATGCEALRRALWRVRPKLAVCGHIHDGRGAKRVMWDLGCRNVAYQEKGVTLWEDPGEGNNKLSLVDLTGKRAPSLANDGSHPDRESDVQGLAASSAFTFSSDVVDAQARHATIGLGGDPNSARCDQAALAGRLGRQETCVVNAAIMKSRYPHVGGKRFNKPIVVDLDLPVWKE